MLRRTVLAAVVAIAAVGAAAGRDQAAPESAEGDAARVAMASPLAVPDFAALFDRDTPIAATAVTARPESDASAVRRAIERENALLLEAFRSGDSAALAGRYTEDASLVSPGNVTVNGRERIAAWFEAQREAGVGDLALHTVDVVRVGELAYETGTWTSRVEVPGRPDAAARSDAGRYYAIWTSRDDGTWSCKVGIWNNNGEALPVR